MAKQAKSEIKTREYLSRLEKNEAFVEFKRSFIKKYKEANPESFQIKFSTKSGDRIERGVSAMNFSKAFDVSGFTKKNNIDMGLMLQIANSWVSPKHAPIENLFLIVSTPFPGYDDESITRYEGSGFPVTLHISSFATKRDILDFIEKSYQTKIKPIQEDLVNMFPVPLKNIRTRNKNIESRDDYIYRNRKKPYKEISRLVMHKFRDILPLNKRNLDQGSIGKIISLEEKRRKQVYYT